MILADKPPPPVPPKHTGPRYEKIQRDKRDSVNQYSTIANPESGTKPDRNAGLTLPGLVPRPGNQEAKPDRNAGLAAAPRPGNQEGVKGAPLPHYDDYVNYPYSNT